MKGKTNDNGIFHCYYLRKILEKYNEINEKDRLERINFLYLLETKLELSRKAGRLSIMDGVREQDVFEIMALCIRVLFINRSQK
jgi:hypothetical protein